MVHECVEERVVVCMVSAVLGIVVILFSRSRPNSLKLLLSHPNSLKLSSPAQITGDTALTEMVLHVVT